MTVSFVDEVPDFWGKEDIEFYYNDSSHCAQNELRGIHEYEKNLGGYCTICARSEFEYAGPAHPDAKCYGPNQPREIPIEEEILKYKLKGKTSAEIARKLSISQIDVARIIREAKTVDFEGKK